MSSTYNLEELVELREQAKLGVKLLENHAETYKTDLEHYSHTENFETSLKNGRNVTKDMLRETTQQTIAILESHEEILDELYSAERNIPSKSNHQIINGEKVDTNQLEYEIQELIDEYREAFESVWRVGYRIYQNPDLDADPINMKYKQWERSFEKEAFPEESIEKYNHLFT